MPALAVPNAAPMPVSRQLLVLRVHRGARSYIRISSVNGSRLSSKAVRTRRTHCEGDAALLLLAMKSLLGGAGTHHADEGRKGRREVVFVGRHGVFALLQNECGRGAWVCKLAGDERWRR
jgi:hypothetical protein